MTVLHSAARALGLFAEDGNDLTVTELARRLDMPKSNASRLLRAMRDAGLLEAVGESKRYRPSLMMVKLGWMYRRSSPLLSRAHDVVQRVSITCGHTGYVSRLEGPNVVGVTDHEGTNALRVVSLIGARPLAFATATGRSLLARLDNTTVSELYDGALPPAPWAASPQSLPELFERLDEIRRGGIATSFDEATRGVAAVAVAVGDPETGEALSLCIAFPAATSQPEERAAIARALHDGASEIATNAHDKKFLPHPKPLRAAE